MKCHLNIQAMQWHAMKIPSPNLPVEFNAGCLDFYMRVCIGHHVRSNLSVEFNAYHLMKQMSMNALWYAMKSPPSNISVEYNVWYTIMSLSMQVLQRYAMKIPSPNLSVEFNVE